MTENERVLLLRKNLKLNQTDFGKQLGIKAKSLSDIEHGKSSLTEQNRLAICRAFHIRDAWLRNGEEPMREPEPTKPTDDLDKILDSYGLPREMRGLFLGYLELSDSAKKEVRDLITRWGSAMNASVVAPPPAEAETAEHSEEKHLSEEEIRQQVADYEARLRYRERLKAEIAEEKMKSAVIASGFKPSVTSGKPVTSGNTGETGGTA